MKAFLLKRTVDLELYELLLLLSLYLKLTNIQKRKKKARKKIDVNLEHREHLATTQSVKKHSAN